MNLNSGNIVMCNDEMLWMQVSNDNELYVSSLIGNQDKDNDDDGQDLTVGQLSNDHAYTQSKRVKKQSEPSLKKKVKKKTSDIENISEESVEKSVESADKSDLRQTLLQFQKDGYLCDTILVGEDGRLKAHSVILAAASDVFKASLKMTAKPKEHVIVLPGLKRYLLQIAILYAYTNDIMVPQEYMTPEHLLVVVNTLTDLGFRLSQTQISATDLSNDVNAVVETDDNHNENDETGELNQDEDASFDYNEISVKQEAFDIADLSNFSNFPTVEADFEQQENIELDEQKIGKKGKKKSEIGLSSQRKRKRVKLSGVNVSSNNADPSGTEQGQENSGAQTSGSAMCDKCGAVFNSLHEYTIHKHRFHRRRPTYVAVQCTVCGITCANQPNLRRHMMRHSGERPHLCQLCGAGFIQKQQLRDHMAKYHPEMIDRTDVKAVYQCKKCGEQLFNQYRYRRHVESQCGTVRSRVLSVIHGDGVETVEDKPYACDKCGRRFRLKASAIIHERVHSENRMAVSMKGATSENDGEDSTTCKTCGKTFTSLTGLIIHRRIHTGEKPYECSICNKHTATLCQLNIHMLRHTGELPHVCKECGKGFRVHAALISHERRHTGEKPYSCPQCGRQTAHAAQLISHMRIHTGERPYKCTVCGKALRQRSHLVSHMRTHTGERPFKCRLCDFSYKQVNDLRIHYRNVHKFELPKKPDRQRLQEEDFQALTEVSVPGLEQLVADNY